MLNFPRWTVEDIKRELLRRERLLIGASALGGALLQTILTLAFWHVFANDRGMPFGSDALNFALVKGALLGGATGYIWELIRTKRDELARKICFAIGGLVLIVFYARLDDWGSSLQWDGCTALWGMLLVAYGAHSAYKQRLSNRA